MKNLQTFEEFLNESSLNEMANLSNNLMKFKKGDVFSGNR